MDKRRLRRLIRKWGKPCPDVDPDCPVCIAWRKFYQRTKEV